MDRQVIKWESTTAFVEIKWDHDGSDHLLKTALDRSGEKRIKVDDSVLEQALPSSRRPPAIVFLPDRLSLITGSPGERRKHFDKLITEIKPEYASQKAAYSEALVQRNALLLRVRATGETPGTIDAWNQRMAETGSALVSSRQVITGQINEHLSDLASELGFRGQLELRHRAGASSDTDEFLLELGERTGGDVERGFTTYGPHRADFVFSRANRDIKTTGSQGEKRMALLSLLMTERELLSIRTGTTPVLLLDDVMSELDASRRRLLVERVTREGQCVITATEFEHVPVEGLTGVVQIPITLEPEGKLEAA